MIVKDNQIIFTTPDEIEKLQQVLNSHIALSGNFYGNEEVQLESEWCEQWVKQIKSK